MVGILSQPQCVNSLRPSDAFMHQYTKPSLIQIMACRLMGAKPLSDQMLVYCSLGHWEWTSVNLESKFKLFIEGNAFENVVCKMSSAKCLPRPQCVIPQQQDCPWSRDGGLWTYRKVSNIRRTKCKNLNDSRLVLQLSVPNPLKPSVKSIMKM